MKNLLKNATKSFLQSKVAMILLAFIVFISSATFTMLNSSSISFQSSYQTVMKEGNVHDFTIKEKWNLNGKIDLSIQQSPQKLKRVAPIATTTVESDFTNNKKMLFYPSLTQDWFDFKGLKNQTPSFYIDLSSAVLSENNGKIMATGQFKIGFLTDPSSFMGLELDSKTSGLKKIDKNDWSSFIAIDLNSKTTTFKIKDGFGNGNEVILKKTNKQIFDEITTLISPQFKIKTLFKYTLDTSKSTGVYKTNWSTILPKLTNMKYPFISEKDLNAFEKDPLILKELKKIKSNMTTFVETQKSDHFLKQIQTKKLKNNKEISEYIYKPSSVKSIFVSAKQNQYKVVSSRFNSADVDKTVLFSGQKPSMPYTDAEMQQGINARWAKGAKLNPMINLPKPTIVKTLNKEKGFHWTQTAGLGAVDNPLFSTGFSNFESLQAVVSSSYVFEHNLKTMTNADLNNFRSEYLNNTKSKSELFSIYKREGKVVTIDSTDYLISGVGTSPDFAFPIINQKNPLPNAKTQAIIFTTKLGFERIKDAFRNNETENYMAFKFKGGVSKAIQNEILEIIKKDSQSKMSWPKGISPLTMRNDINERVILAPQRISFLKNIQQSIATISYLTTSMLSVLMLFIIAMVIKKQINSKRKILSILLANGYTKNQISISMMSIAFIIIAIPAMIGYVSGYFMQLLFISIFNNYWTLPMVFNSFSFITMSLVIGLPMLITMIVAYIATRTELKGDLLSVMKESSSKTGGWITTKINSKLSFIKAKGKITISLFTSNLSKMFMAFITSTMAIITGSVAFSILGKFDYAKKTSASPINYSFKIDLETPTSATNKYETETIKEFGLPANKTWDKTIDPNDMYQNIQTAMNSGRPYFHWVQDLIVEGNFAKTTNYLKHKIQLSFLLDMKMGGLTNPWTVAKGSMPDNQLNQSVKQDLSFLMSSYSAIKNYANLGWFNKLDPTKKQTVSKLLEDVKKQTWFKNILKHKSVSNVTNPNTMVISEEFKNFIFFSLKTQIINRLNGWENHLPFMISYGNIVKDVSDETYSQLQFNYSNSGKSSTVSSRIIGLQPNSKMVSLNKENLEKLNKYQMNDINTPDNKSDAIPIIINSYFKEAYKVRVGQTIDLEIQNHKDKNDSTKFHTTKAKIIGVEETYNGIKIYSLQKFVNNKLGYTPGQNIFNGVFTKKENNPLIFSGVNLYSESDFYIGAASVSQSDPIWTEMEKVINDPTKWSNQSVNDYPTFVSAYSSTPYVLSMSNANWAAMSEYAFNNTLDLTNKMIWMIEIIAILIALFFISIIALMIVDNNKTFIATTKVLGYKKREIKSMFFRSLIIPLLFGAIVAAPITYAALIGIKYIIMSFGAILVPVSIIWWSIPAALLILIVLFSIIYRVAMNKFGNKQMLEAFKA